LEALVLLLGEFLFALFGGLFLLTAQFVGGLIFFVLELAFMLMASAGETKVKTPAFKKPAWKIPKWLKTSQKIIGGFLILTLICAFVINSFFFEATLQKIAEVVGNKTDIHLTFAEANGSFFSGHVELKKASIVRTSHESSNFDFTVDRLNIDLAVMQILRNPTRIEIFEIESLSGSVEHKRSKDDKSSKPQKAEPIKPRRSFEIKTLLLSDVDLTITDNTQPDEPFIFPVTVTHLEANPLRSSHALFDLLFRANAGGSLANRPFTISTTILPDGRDTSWRVNDLPIELLSHYVGGVFKYIKTGVIDIEVDDQWRKAQQTEIDTHWKLTLKGVTAEAPENAGKWTKALAGATVKYINENGEHLPLSVGFTMNEDEFKGAASLEAAGLWKVFTGAIIKELSSQLNIESTELKEAAKTEFNKFVNFLDEKRKKPADSDSGD